MAQWSDEFLPLGRAYHWEKVARARNISRPADERRHCPLLDLAADHGRGAPHRHLPARPRMGARLARRHTRAQQRVVDDRRARRMDGRLRHRAALSLAARGLHPRPAAARRCSRLLSRRDGRSRSHAAGNSRRRVAHRHAQRRARCPARLRPPLGRHPRRMPADLRLTHPRGG